MINRFKLELGVGLFVLIGLGCAIYLALRVGEYAVADAGHARFTARFVSASGLRIGAPVELAGVRVGRVVDIALDAESYEAVVTLALQAGVRLQRDAKASIRTQGIIGDKFVKLTPGGADELLASGDEIFETEPSISLEELISKYIFQSDG